jgi:hypothetical protein
MIELTMSNLSELAAQATDWCQATVTCRVLESAKRWVS